MARRRLRSPAYRTAARSSGTTGLEADVAALFDDGAGGFYDGALYNPSNSATVFQERTGASATTPAEADDPVGTILDLSGNDNHAVTPSDAARPVLRLNSGVYSLDYDGTDDYLSATMTLVDGMEFFGALKTSDTQGMLGNLNLQNTVYYGVWQDGSASTTLSANVGTVAYYKDGNLVSPTTRDDFHTLIADGSWHELEVRGLDLAAQPSWQPLYYSTTAAFRVDGDVGPMVLIPTAALDAGARTLIKDWIDGEVGL